MNTADDPRGPVVGPCPACGSPQYDDAYWMAVDRYSDTVPAAHHEELRQVMLAERRRAEQAEANYRFMVERAADEKLDGYRELGARAAAAEERAERAELKVARLVEGARIDEDLAVAAAEEATILTDRAERAERERDAANAAARL